MKVNIVNLAEYLIENASEAFEHKDRELLEAALRRYFVGLEQFSLSFFSDLYQLCYRVYKEKPEIVNFNKYVEELIEKDLS